MSRFMIDTKQNLLRKVIYIYNIYSIQTVTFMQNLSFLNE